MAVSDSPSGGSTPPHQEQQANSKYGFTKPLSLAGPTDADLQRNNDLDKVRFKFLIRLVSFTICLTNPAWNENLNSRFVLLQFLLDSGLYESNEESAARKEVLHRLDQVFYFSDLAFVVIII